MRLLLSIAAVTLIACDGTQAVPADTAPPDTAPDDVACGLEPTVELLLEDASIGWMAASPDGRYIAALVNFNFGTKTGDLRVVDLTTSTATDVVAASVRAPAFFTSDGTSLIYRAGPTRQLPGDHVTWEVRAYYPADGAIVAVGSDVAMLELSKRTPFIAFQTEVATFIYDAEDRIARPVTGGEAPCQFDISNGFTCGALTFTDDDQLLFASHVDAEWPYPSTLARTRVKDPTATTTIATGVNDYSAWAGGKVVLYSEHTTFDPAPDCMCPRADLVAAAADGAYARTLLPQARYASPRIHATVDAAGETVAFYDPDRNPTEVTLQALGSGQVVWRDPDSQLATPYELSAGVLAWKPTWTGTHIDRAIDVIARDPGASRVRLASEVRQWIASTPVLETAKAVAIVEHEDTGSYYNGPTRIRVWDVDGVAPVERANVAFSTTPALSASSFDAHGEDLALLHDYRDNWRGRISALLVGSGEIKRVSSSTDAYAASWVGDWIAFLEERSGSVEAAPLGLARRPFDEATRQLGTSVHGYAPIPGACPSLAFLDCAAPNADAAACAGAAPGIYRVKLP